MALCEGALTLAKSKKWFELTHDGLFWAEKKGKPVKGQTGLQGCSVSLVDGKPFTFGLFPASGGTSVSDAKLVLRAVDRADMERWISALKKCISGDFAPSSSSSTTNAFDSTQQSDQPKVVRVYTKDGSYKSLMASSDTLLGDLCAQFAEKLRLGAHVQNFALREVCGEAAAITETAEKSASAVYLSNSERVFSVLSRWEAQGYSNPVTDSDKFRLVFGFTEEVRRRQTIKLAQAKGFVPSRPAPKPPARGGQSGGEAPHQILPKFPAGTRPPIPKRPAGVGRNGGGVRGPPGRVGPKVGSAKRPLNPPGSLANPARSRGPPPGAIRRGPPVARRGIGPAAKRAVPPASMRPAGAPPSRQPAAGQTGPPQDTYGRVDDLLSRASPNRAVPAGRAFAPARVLSPSGPAADADSPAAYGAMPSVWRPLSPPIVEGAYGSVPEPRPPMTTPASELHVTPITATTVITPISAPVSTQSSDFPDSPDVAYQDNTGDWEGGDDGWTGGDNDNGDGDGNEFDFDDDEFDSLISDSFLRATTGGSGAAQGTSGAGSSSGSTGHNAASEDATADETMAFLAAELDDLMGDLDFLDDF